jgi:tryptophan synthase alpha chain
MSTRIAKVFAACANEERTAFIPYLMAGDPSPEMTLGIMHALADNGADLLEIGFPFSDPTADGITIQEAGNRALAEGMTLQKVLALCAEFRTRNITTPLILMGYANPVMQYGYADCASAMAKSGIDGVILVDLPPEEESEFLPHLNAHAIALIRLVAPTTEGARLQRLLATAGGFVYAISINGITGTGSADMSALKHRIAEIRSYSALPVVAGFGIRTTTQAHALHGIADGVVVGSALVEALHQAGEAGGVATASRFAHAMAEALREE